ncbi:scopoletin glucosyltransferase-like [Silene latifolia]|uniref:scopoletin glucosyltransferase-like n=1 Tax=Silene latifolia TaxID=37657 RepID=UPI003D7842A2
MSTRIDEIETKVKIFFLPFIVGSGHLGPMINAARLFATHPQVKVKIITTPRNADLFQNIINHAHEAGHDISFVTVELPTAKVGLPDNIDGILNSTSNEVKAKLFKAIFMLKGTILDILVENRADCLVTDPLYPWALDVSKAVEVPWIVFHSSSLFVLCAQDSLTRFTPHHTVGSDSEPFFLPGLPDRVYFTRSGIPDSFRGQTVGAEFLDAVQRSVEQSYAMMVNSFDELEVSYVDYCKRVLRRKRLFLVGPLHCYSAIKMSDDKHNGDGKIDSTMQWLDSKLPNSVVYVSFGSYAALCREQSHELAFGLESSGKPFVWVARVNLFDENWFPMGFEDRIKKSNQGLIIKEWAPQVSILSHPSVGAFMTHCGWNSILEGLSSGVTMITWPLRAEQFFNESLVVDVLKVGIRVGNEEWMSEDAEPKLNVSKEKVAVAVARMMDGGEEVVGMRKRVEEYMVKCKEAVEVGGSSYQHVYDLVDDLKTLRKSSKSMTS